MSKASAAIGILANPYSTASNSWNGLNSTIHGHFGDAATSALNIVDPTGLSGETFQNYVDPMGATPDPDNSASQTWANIARGDWNRYKQMYMPVEDMLAGYINNPGYNQSMINKNVSSFDSHNAAAQGGIQRSLQSYGLSMNPGQQQAFDRQSNIQKGLGEVEASNRTRRDLTDMQYLILGAGNHPDTAPQNAPVV